MELKEHWNSLSAEIQGCYSYPEVLLKARGQFWLVSMGQLAPP